MNEYDLPIPERGLVAHPALKLEVTVYVPSARLESENELLFPIRQQIAGAGLATYSIKSRAVRLG